MELKSAGPVKKARSFETRDIEKLAAISEILYKAKIRYRITIKTYAPGEPVKYRFVCDPMTDKKREEIAKAIKEA